VGVQHGPFIFLQFGAGIVGCGVPAANEKQPGKDWDGKSPD